MQPITTTDILNAGLAIAPELREILMLITSIVVLNVLLSILTIFGLWRVYKKAGKPGWTALIPIYNMIVILQIIQRPIWWVLLMVIPLVNIFVGWLIMVELGKCFGKSTGWGILFMILFGWIGIIVLGFGDSKYQLKMSQKS